MIASTLSYLCIEQGHYYYSLTIISLYYYKHMYLYKEMVLLYFIDKHSNVFLQFTLL